MHCRFIIVRHGQTYWNAARKFQGQVNIPLNDTGRAQAAEVAKRLEKEPIEICYSSPLVRAMETAEIILRPHDLTPIPEPLILERSYGLYEGDNFDLAFHNPGHELFNMKHPALYGDHVITVETYPQILARTRKFIYEVMLPAAEKYDCVMIAAHCDVLNSLFMNLFDVKLDDYWEQSLPNAGFAFIDYDDGAWKMIYRSDMEEPDARN